MTPNEAADFGPDGASRLGAPGVAARTLKAMKIDPAGFKNVWSGGGGRGDGGGGGGSRRGRGGRGGRGGGGGLRGGSQMSARSQYVAGWLQGKKTVRRRTTVQKAAIAVQAKKTAKPASGS